METKDFEYLRFFHEVVTLGVICGLQHPIEWAVSSDRSCVDVLPGECQHYTNEHMPRFLCEMYQHCTFEIATTAEEIFEWVDKCYEKNPMCKGYFLFLKEGIDKYIEESKKI